MATNKKKVIFFIPTFPVISETFIRREVEGLLKRGGLEITVLALKKGNAKWSPFFDGKVEYIRLSFWDVVFGFVDYLVLKPRNFLSMPRVSGLFVWIKATGYARIFQKYKPQHIHAHFMSEISTIAMFSAKFLRLPFSVSGHARDVFAKTNDLASNPHMLGEKIRQASFVVLCNKKAYDECLLQTSDEDKRKVHLIYHGLDFSEQVEIRRPAEDAAVPVLLYLGRFVEKKGLKYLLDAAKLLVDQKRGFLLQLAGFGPQADELKRYADQLGLRDQVLFISDGSGIPHENALQLVAECTAFIMPAIETDESDSDGIPNTILEAGMYKKPVIATDAGSISEVITDLQTGLVVPQKDSQALAIAINRLLDDSMLRGYLGNRLHDLVKENFDSDKNLPKFESLFFNL